MVFKAVAMSGASFFLCVLLLFVVPVELMWWQWVAEIQFNLNNVFSLTRVSHFKHIQSILEHQMLMSFPRRICLSE